MIKNAYKSAFAGFFDRGSFFVFTILLARESSLEILGLYTFLFVAISVVVNPLSFALNSTYTRKLAEMKGANLFGVLTDNLLISIFVILTASTIFMIFDTLVVNLAVNLSYELLASCFFLAIAETLRKLMIGIYIGIADFNSYLYSAIFFACILNIPIIFIFDIEVIDAILIHATSSVSSGILGLVLVIKKHKNFNKIFRLPDINTIRSYIIPASLSSLVPSLGMLAINSVISSSLGIAAVGMFAIGNQLRFAMAFLPAAIDNVFKSRLVRNFSTQKNSFSEEFYKVFLQSFIATTVSGLIGLLILLTILPDVIGLFDVEYNKYLFIFFACAGFIQALCQTISNAILSRSSFWLGFIFNLVWIASFFSLFITLVKSLGLVAISFAMLVAYFILFVIQGSYLLKNLKILQS